MKEVYAVYEDAPSIGFIQKRKSKVSQTTLLQQISL